MEKNLIKVKTTFNNKELLLTQHEINMLNKLCLVCVKDIFKRNNISFNDIEKINNYSENHNINTKKYIAYQKREIKKAIHNFGLYTTNYLILQ